MPTEAVAVAHSPQKSSVNPQGAPAERDSAHATNAPQQEEFVRLHITPFTPALLKVYLAPSVLPLAKNISYHVVETFPEKGYGYVDLPAMEAQKLKKKLNGSTLKGSKVKIENAKPEKRKALAEADAAEAEKPAKRVKKEKSKKKKEQGVLEGVELPEGRKVKRGWTETAAEKKKAKKEKREKDKDKKEKKAARKESKYTKEPELLFNAKLTPVAANEMLRKEKKKEKKEKKDKKKSNAREVVIHEFEHNTKTPSFLKSTQVAADPKPAVEYINGKGWVDEDGNVVEPETGKAKNRRLLELAEPTPAADRPTKPTEATSPKSKAKSEKKIKKKQVTPPALSSESSDDDAESSVVSSSSEDEESSASADESSPTPASPTANTSALPDLTLTGLSPPATSTPKQKEEKEVHPLEALFKRPKPPALSPSAATTTSTPAKTLAPIKTAFSFFDNDVDTESNADGPTSNNPPMTPFTQRDLEWRGLRSAAPTPDTAAIGRKFSFDWRKEGSNDIEEEDEEVDEEADEEMRGNTVANMHLADGGDEEEDEEGGDEDAAAGAKKGDGEGEAEESAFGKWFWEARGDSNRAWKKRRRETLKAKRLRENRKLMGGRRVA